MTTQSGQRLKHSFRHRYNPAELFSAGVKFYPAVIILKQNGKAQIISDNFRERLMLAVTEVNGCEVCSYAHTKMALEQGMSHEEIRAMLAASDEYVPADEGKAIFFAQHYADSLGKPEYDAYLALFDAYGEQKTRVIIAAIRVMMFGNICGLPISAFFSRLHGNKYSNSNIVYEIGMIIAIIPVTLIAGIPALVNRLIGRTILKTGGR